jgi:hypothetical protein
MQDLPINSDDADWQQMPDGTVPHDTSRDTLPERKRTTMPSPRTEGDDASLTELFKQALKEQEQDYSQGKYPRRRLTKRRIILRRAHYIKKVPGLH